MTPKDDEPADNDFHPLIAPVDTLVMPTGELPVVRDGTVGGVPSYEDDEHTIVWRDA